MNELNRNRLIPIIMLLLLGIPAACTSPQPSDTVASRCLETPINHVLLNSERIEQCFGSFGIEILTIEEPIRVVNLYSVDNGRKILRTFAVTHFNEAIPEVLFSVYQRIRSGGSIGATLKSAGWQVEKQSAYVGGISAGNRFARLAALEQKSALAFHVYDLYAVRGNERHTFARIAEVHHPEYLRLSDLRTIYGSYTSDIAETRLIVSAAMED
jgi:hypothetical protein